MASNEAIEELQREVASIRADIGKLTEKMVELMHIWANALDQNSGEHSQFAKAIQALAAQAEIMSAQLEKIEKGRDDA